MDQDFTFIINCTAMGVPTPQVVWRLNWGHVPSKCNQTNTVLESDHRSYGELVCPMAVESDQGAYSCEAINSLGSCFAGSAGCGQPGQDAVLVVNTGAGVCGPGSFNSEARTRDQCLSCHCSGVTDSCKSSDLYLSTLPPPSGVFQIISVELPSFRPPLPGPVQQDLEKYLRRTRDNQQRLMIAQVSEDSDPLYLALPPSHAGNLLKSYGSRLMFKLKFSGSDMELIDAPTVIIKVSNENGL